MTRSFIISNLSLHFMAVNLVVVNERIVKPRRMTKVKRSELDLKEEKEY